MKGILESKIFFLDLRISLKIFPIFISILEPFNIQLLPPTTFSMIFKFSASKQQSNTKQRLNKTFYGQHYFLIKCIPQLFPLSIENTQIK